MQPVQEKLPNHKRIIWFFWFIARPYQGVRLNNHLSFSRITCLSYKFLRNVPFSRWGNIPLLKFPWLGNGKNIDCLNQTRLHWLFLQNLSVLIGQWNSVSLSWPMGSTCMVVKLFVVHVQWMILYISLEEDTLLWSNNPSSHSLNLVTLKIS